MIYALFILCFLATAVSLYFGRRAALAYGFADKPGGRKKHDNPIPPIGGLAILPMFALFTQLSGLDAVVPWPLIAGLGVLLVMGAVDDARTVHPLIKFTIMVWTACFVVIFGHAQIGNLGDLFGFGPVWMGMVSKPFTVMCLVLLMNAINMMDGVDGLAGGFCALMALWLAAACAAAGQTMSAQALMILVAALLGFLAFNLRHPGRKKASVFMGDSGSLCLGLVLGWFSIRLSQTVPPAIEPVAVIWIIAVPVIDAFALFIARSLRGLHPFEADRRHLHHRLLDAGLTPGQTTFAILALVSLMALIGLAGTYYHVPPVILFVLWVVLLGLHVRGILHPRGYALFVRAIRLRRRAAAPVGKSVHKDGGK